MQEFEPKKRNKIVTKEFLAKNAYIFVIAIILIGGITYGYTFFVQNKKIASGSITTAALTINFTDRSISASGLSVPNDDQEGLTEYSKSVTITNQTDIDGRVKLTLTRTSGLALTDMRYALIVNGAIQEIDDVPSDGKILETAIMGGSPTGETISVEIRLWPKTTYSGSTTTFVGELTPEIKYLGNTATNISSPAGKYVNFNCNGSTCEEWQIVKVEDDRLVLTRQADYTNATSRTNSNRYNPTGSFNDNSLITSLSTDEKNVYLAKTVKITSGSGTIDDPYILSNNDYRESDKKVQAVITYKDSDGTTTLGTQNVYYGETNYISRTVNNSTFLYWNDGTNHYVLGDTITTITSDTNLTANYKQPTTMILSSNSGTIRAGNSDTVTITTNGDGLLSCVSSNNSYATCSISGTTLTITGVAEGSATITVSQAEGATHLAATNVTYAATISPAMVTITYNANGGTVSPTSKEMLLSSTTYGDLPKPTRPTGLYFDGWYTDPTGGTKVTSATSFVGGTSPTTLYAHWVTYVCRRVTNSSKLHTETCGQTSGFCATDGYTGSNTLITYGNAKALNSSLAVGDAFDCDVDGNGIIDTDGNGKSIERFYYISEYYNTDTRSFDNISNTNSYVTLIFYRNTVNGSPSDEGAPYATQADAQTVGTCTNSSGCNVYGPVTAVKHLPTSGSWSNMELKTTSRIILACRYGNCNDTSDEPSLTVGGVTIQNPFSYAGKAARLLTLQELKKSGCDTLSGKSSLGTSGSLKACNFLFEGMKYANSSSGRYGPWLENPHSNYSVYSWVANDDTRGSNYSNIDNPGQLAVRPAIDVPVSALSK